MKPFITHVLTDVVEDSRSAVQEVQDVSAYPDTRNSPFILSFAC